jgi:hypothetical protein
MGVNSWSKDGEYCINNIKHENDIMVPSMRTEWVATWRVFDRQYLASAFSTRSMALDWVGDRDLVSLIEVGVSCNDESISK